MSHLRLLGPESLTEAAAVFAELGGGFVIGVCVHLLSAVLLKPIRRLLFNEVSSKLKYSVVVMLTCHLFSLSKSCANPSPSDTTTLHQLHESCRKCRR